MEANARAELAGMDVKRLITQISQTGMARKGAREGEREREDGRYETRSLQLHSHFTSTVEKKEEEGDEVEKLFSLHSCSVSCKKRTCHPSGKHAKYLFKKKRT